MDHYKEASIGHQHPSSDRLVHVLLATPDLHCRRNSAKSANVLERSLVSAVFSSFGAQMNCDLGIVEAASLLSMTGVAIVTVPLNLYLHARSRESNKHLG